MIRFLKKNKKGFTLVELIVVIAILGILAAIAIPRITGQTDAASEAADEATLRIVRGAIAMYRAQNGIFPVAATYAALSTRLAPFMDLGTPPEMPEAQQEGYEFRYTDSTGTVELVGP